LVRAARDKGADRPELRFDRVGLDASAMTITARRVCLMAAGFREFRVVNYRPWKRVSLQLDRSM
jgi:hypothetical protein